MVSFKIESPFHFLKVLNEFQTMSQLLGVCLSVENLLEVRDEHMLQVSEPPSRHPWLLFTRIDLC